MINSPSLKVNDRLVLGTVQLGMPYGIANESGQPDYQQAKAIVLAAWEGGIRYFDTAQGYGESETVLARALVDLELIEDVRVFTKINPSVDHRDKDSFRQAIFESCQLFGSALYGIILHREDYLQDWSEGLGEVLREYRDAGYFSTIGVSVYDPPAARKALEMEGIDLVQLPANVLDRRHESAGVFKLARSFGKTIMIRSVFLQGALLQPIEKLPKQIQHIRPYLQPVLDVANSGGVAAQDLAMGFVREHWPESLVVFGAERAEQVKKNIASWHKVLPSGVVQEVENTTAKAIPLEVVRPDLWQEEKLQIEGSRLYLRKLQPADAWGQYVRWMNDPEVTRFLESRFCSYSSEDLEKYILSQLDNTRVIFLAIVEKTSGRHIGNIKIGPLHNVHGTAELGFLIGEKDCWGKGYATEAISLAVDVAFDSLSARKIIAGCYSNNIASGRAFLKNGFAKEGYLKQHVIDGDEISDVLQFGLLRNSWQ